MENENELKNDDIIYCGNGGPLFVRSIRKKYNFHLDKIINGKVNTECRRKKWYQYIISRTLVLDKNRLYYKWYIFGIHLFNTYQKNDDEYK